MQTGASAGPREGQRIHLKHVEGMRAVAALVVYVNHAYAQIWNPSHGQFPDGILLSFSYVLVAGHLCVTVFIVISGFCLALPVVRGGDRLRGGSKGFFQRRARRILPPYYGAVAFSLILIATIIGKPTGTLWDVPILVTPVSIVSHLLLLQDLFATSSINYVFWSIAVEWQIYFFFPLLVWAWGRYGPWVTATVALVFGYAIRIGFGSTRISRAHPHFIGIFVLGMLAAYVSTSSGPFYVKARQKGPWLLLAIGGLAVVAGLTAWWGILPSTERFHWLDLPVSVMTTSVLVLSARSETNILKRVFSFAPLAFIGTVSYSFYLIHAPVLQVLWQYVIRPANLSPNIAFAFLLTLGLLFVLGTSYLFFRVLEEPFMRAPEKKRLPSPAPAR